VGDELLISARCPSVAGRQVKRPAHRTSQAAREHPDTARRRTNANSPHARPASRRASAARRVPKPAQEHSNAARQEPSAARRPQCSGCETKSAARRGGVWWSSFLLLDVRNAIANILDRYSLAQVSEVFRNKLCYDGKFFTKNNVDLFSN